MSSWTRLAARWTDPAAPAITAEGICLDYRALGDRVARASGLLAGLGVGPGDRVALMVPRSLAFLELFLGALRLGATAIPLNDRYSEPEIAFLLGDARPAVSFLVDPLADAHGAIRASTVRGALDAAAPCPPGAPSDEDVAVLCYTSGTTGRPKGALIRHANVQATVDALHRAWGWSSGDVLVHALPLNHVHGLFVAQLGALWAGAHCAWVDRFWPDAVWAAIARFRATMFMGVPTFYTRLLASAATPDLSSMRLFTCGSAPLPARVLEAFEQRFGHRILERYGVTEVGIVLSNPLHGPRKAGAVGVPLPGVEARITGPHGADVAPGETGELRIRGPSVFAGYLGRPEATEAAIGDGWMHTGDLGRFDGDGYVFLSGRASDLVLVGGLNVYPREIEAALLEHPAVADAAVVGVPDADLGEVPCAGVVLRSPATEGELRAHARGRLAPYKVPPRILAMSDLPRNAMGKVVAAALRRRFVAIEVGPATAEDAPEIARRNRAMALETEDLALPERVALAGVEAVFARDVGAHYLLARVAGEVVGQLMITTEWSDWRNAPVWWIQSVYVEPQWRGSGVFRALYREVSSAAASAGAAGVRLYVDRRNLRAAEVYRKVGMDGEHYLVFEQMSGEGSG